MKNPCYDRNTKSDCPDRKAGCAAKCPEWAAYVEERERMYKKRKDNRDLIYGLRDAKRNVKRRTR